MLSLNAPEGLVVAVPFFLSGPGLRLNTVTSRSATQALTSELSLPEKRLAVFEYLSVNAPVAGGHPLAVLPASRSHWSAPSMTVSLSSSASWV